MKKSISAVLAIFFSFFVFSPTALAEESKLLDPSNDPWDSVMQVHVKKDMGCQIQSGFSQQFMKWVERRVCPQTFESFYARMSTAQKAVALKEGLKILRGLMDDHPKRDKMALLQFFLEYTGSANPS